MKFTYLIFFLLISNYSFSQQNYNGFADTVFIYQGFGSGGSTASLNYYSKAVDTIPNVTRMQLNPISLDTLNFLIGHIKSKRHSQQKIGQSYYASVIKEGKERRIAIVPHWAIIDLTNKRQYVFRGTPYAEIYNRFVNKNYR